MNNNDSLPKSSLAPCGVNCSVCYAFLRNKKPCFGCRGADEHKPQHCRICKIRACADRQPVRFCFECPTFPCVLIKRLDKSYRQRYQISLIADAARHRDAGSEAYLRAEQTRWSCPICGGVVCMHDRICSACGTVAASPTPE